MSDAKHTSDWVYFPEHREVMSPDGAICEVYGAEADAHGRLLASAPDLLAAAERVLAHLNARIDAAVSSGTVVPVFDGIADLHTAVAKAKEGVP